MNWQAWRCFWPWRKRNTQIGLQAGQWLAILRSVPILQGLSCDEEQRLIELARAFLQQKTLTPIGLSLSTPQRAWMALQACLPVLNLGLDWYRNFYEVILLPDVVERQQSVRIDRDLIGIQDQWHLGEAWEQGPVVLVWPEVLHDGQWDGYHLVIHELIHKLDMLAGGHANGMPPERPGIPIRTWQSVLERAFRQFTELTTEQRWLDEQAAESLAEFFAISGECFFTDPVRLTKQAPELYAVLGRWFGQDPASRAPVLSAGSVCTWPLQRH